MKLRFLITALLLLTWSQCIHADFEPKETDVVINQKNPRPKDNSTSEINFNCTYVDGVLIFKFHVPEGKAKLTVVNLDNGQRHDATFLTFNSYSHYMGDEPGNYRIDLDTSAGGAYFGYLTIPRQ